MTMAGDNLFDRMCKEAMETIAQGSQGWKEMDTNTLILACFGMVTNHMTAKVVRPLWFFASTVFAGFIWYIVSTVFGIG